MLQKIIIVLLVVLTIKCQIANAVTMEQAGYKPIHAIERQKLTIGSVEMYKTIIDSYATKYGVESDLLASIISCESGFNRYALGDQGQSRGLSQIHAIYHPEISDSEAYDPDFAIRFLAKSISEGKGRQWTCFRMIVDKPLAQE